MSTVKLPTTESYRDYFLTALQERDRATGYLEELLDLEGEEPLDIELLKAGLQDILDSQQRNSTLSETAKQQFAILKQLLSESGGAEITALLRLLDALGLKVSIQDH
ncbi:hypothetical protein PN462_13505 [Spirulina sp. CS-785/01]|uniref:hypothetical protein n=1 Tax=Spirulina sp. CS-785/01 TaxID=3021716 RepID=UPI00232E5F6B|nr:hypothetical protein [Spirulina sp. CS-785/01]MDB9314122.1 hypothetical protein [Spirulina sp. CS-785/01]